MTAVISGANGFIGSRLVKKLASNGLKTIALVKDENEKIDGIKDHADIVYCDFSDPESTYRTLSDMVDRDCVVYHFAWAGVNGPLKADYASQIGNVKMACDCAALAKRLNAKRFLASGTVAENAVKSYSHLDKLNGGLMYATAKLSAKLFIETLCKNIGLPFVWMRFSNIYGPDNKTGNLVSYTIEQLSHGQKASFGPATQQYDFVYADDLIEAVYRLGTIENLNHNDYFIGSGKPRILMDYLKEIGNVVGRPQLIDIGARADDGIVYTADMFDISNTVNDIGDYVSRDFEEAIRYTVANYGME